MKKTLSAILAILMLITCFVSVVIPASAENFTISSYSKLSAAAKNESETQVWNITKDIIITKKISVNAANRNIVIEGNGHTITASSGLASTFSHMFYFNSTSGENEHFSVTINNLNLVCSENFRHPIVINRTEASSNGVTVLLNNVTIDHTKSAVSDGNCAIINNSCDLTLSGSIIISTGINNYSAIDNDNSKGQASFTIASGANLTINDNRIFTERLRNPAIQSDMSDTGVNMLYTNYSTANLVPVQRIANFGYDFGESLDPDVTNTKELDINYNVAVTDVWTDVTKVKLTWVIGEINATYTSRKVWNPDTLSWDEVRENASAPAAYANFTIVNFSSKEVIASAAFKTVEDDDIKATFSSAYYTNNGKKIGTVVNKNYTIDDEKKANVPANTIGAAIEFHEDKFTALDATTTATKYGTFTITIAEADACKVCQALEAHTEKYFNTLGVTTYEAAAMMDSTTRSDLTDTYLGSDEFAALKDFVDSENVAEGATRCYKADGTYDTEEVYGADYTLYLTEYYCVDHPETITFVPAL